MKLNRAQINAANRAREDQFAELLSEELSFPEIREAMGITKGMCSGMFSRLRQKLGDQAC